MKIDLLANHQHLFPEIAQIKYDHYHPIVPEKSLEDFHKSLIRDANEDNLPIGYIALENNGYAGTASLRIHDMDSHCHLTPWLGGVFVHPDHRNKGVGTLLVRHVISKAKMQGHERLYLFTWDKAAWYAKMGWKPMESALYHGQPVTIMHYDLL